MYGKHLVYKSNIKLKTIVGQRYRYLGYFVNNFDINI